MNSAPDFSNTADTFVRDGFAPMQGVLGPEEVIRLQQACTRLLGNNPRPRGEFGSHRGSSEWEYRAYTDGRTHLAVDVVGQDPDFDALLERIFSAPSVKSALNALHGPSYKLTQVNVRKVVKGDPGLGFHQDTTGETGIGVLLDDRPDLEGTTVFIPGSHRWPATIRELFVYPRVPLSAIPRSQVQGGLGKAGDMYFFINRLWHSRFPLVKYESATAILMSVFAAGSKYRVHRVPQRILSTLGPECRRLLDPEIGVRDAGSGLAEVLSANTPESRPPELTSVLAGQPAFGHVSPWQLARPWRLVTNAVTRVVRRP